MEQAEGHQEHPLQIYFVIWITLFVLSGFSYAVDYFNLQGMLRWSLILLFMWAKAALIVSIFMHMRWERLALITAILVPPLCLGVFVFLMSVEGSYIEHTRSVAFGVEPATPIAAPHH